MNNIHHNNKYQSSFNAILIMNYKPKLIHLVQIPFLQHGNNLYFNVIEMCFNFPFVLCNFPI